MVNLDEFHSRPFNFDSWPLTPESARPIRFLLVGVGSVGDVYPCLGIGAALRARGHEVAIIANPYYRKTVEEVGLDFLPIGAIEHQQKLISHPDTWDPRVGWRVWIRLAARLPMRQMYQSIADNYVPGKTVVATSWGGFGARIAQDRLGVPTATLHLEPDKFRSVYQTAIMPPPVLMWDCLPKFVKRLQYRMVDRTFDRVVAPRINELRAEFGLSPVRRVFTEWTQSPQRVIGLFPDWWWPPQPDWPPQSALTGFPLWDRADQLDTTESDAFLNAGDPPIVFSPGAINLQAGRFFKAAVDACRQLGRRGMLLTKHPELLVKPLPDGVRHFSYVRYTSLLPRSAAMVHHGGIGTVAQCLAAGIPQVVTPLMHFHRETAVRLKRLGVAVSIRPKAVSGRLLVRALEQMLNSRQVVDSCRQAAARFEGVDPIARTCDLLEELAGTDGKPSIDAI